MKSKLTLSELFELAKNAAPVMQAGEIESLTGKGISSPLAARAAFKPRRILGMFNPTRILIMTTIVVIITSIALILNPFRDKSSDTKQDPAATGQNAERVESRKIVLPGVEALTPKISQPQEPEREPISMGVPVKAPAQTVQTNSKDTVFEGEILRLSKEELTKLGFIFDQEGYYYLNQLPDGSKLNFWSFKGSRGGSYGFGAGGYINQSNKASLRKNNFYPVALTNLRGEEINPLNTYSAILNQESFERINDTLVPVLFSRQMLGGYNVPDRLVWFKVSDAFFDGLDPLKTNTSRKVYQAAITSGNRQNPVNLVLYDYKSFFPALAVVKVKPEVLHCLGIQNTSDRISFSYKHEGMVYYCWADSSGFGVESHAITHADSRIEYLDSQSIPSVVVITTENSGQPTLPKLSSEINPEMLVPICIDNPDASLTIKEMVFWIYPNEKTLSCLPPEIGEPMRKEFAYQQKRLDPGFVPKMGGSIGIKGGGLAGDTTRVIGSLGIGVNLKQDSIDIDPEPVPCVYFTNLCESLSGVDYVNLYPNPATDNLTIDLILQSSKEIRFRVLDLGGRVISDDGSPVSFSGGGQVQHRLDVSRLKNGLYLLLMTDEEGARLTRRFVKN